MSKLVALLPVLLLACGGSSNPATDSGGGSDGGGSGVDGAIGSDGFVTLIQRSWSMPKETEGYKCTRIAVPTDMWITGFHAIEPTGTHHEVLTISDTGTANGDYDCDAGSLDTKMLYAAGVGTDDLMFPDGVAMHLAAGSLINLNLHLFNVGETDINNATSGIQVKVIDPAKVQQEADMEFAGTFLISVADDHNPHTAVGGCNAPADWHIFTLWPHMHQTAVHQKLTVDGVALLDDDYQFAEQKNYPIADTLISKGQNIQVTCTYIDDRGDGKTIGFGESSTDEMCFTGMYKYPADGNTFGCVTGAGGF